jgi:cephalosporin hydroxylase
MADEAENFAEDVRRNISGLRQSPTLQKQSLDWVRDTAPYKYSYNFTWLGRPIIQFPQDMVAMQELIWSIRPQVILETGIAHGGSLIFHASILELACGTGTVVGVDIDIRAHNRKAIEAHPMMKRIRMIEGSSIDPTIMAAVRAEVGDAQPVIVILDSNHTHDHVLAELRAYSPFVRKGSYLVVLDTTIEDMPPDMFPDRPWGVGNNPKTAVQAFLKENTRFQVDHDFEAKLLITVGLGGYLKCIEDPA